MRLACCSASSAASAVPPPSSANRATSRLRLVRPERSSCSSCSALPIFAGVYAAGLVLVFTASRYRAPLWPLLTIAAVAAVMALATEPRARRRLAGLGAVVALVLVAVVPGPFAQESVDLEAELWHGLGFNQLRRGELAPAAARRR